MRIDTFDQLRKLLFENNIPCHLFGQNKAKTLQNLFDEIREGECTLCKIEGRLSRFVRVAAAIIPHKTDRMLCLHWVGQTFPDGKKISKRELPGGKVKSGQEIVVSLLGKLFEKLQLEFSQHNVVFIRELSITKESSSYPNLLTLRNKFEVTMQPNSSLRKIAFSLSDLSGGVHHFDWLPLQT